MNRLIKIVVCLAALIPFVEMIYIAVTEQMGSNSGSFILAYSGSWALNFLVFSLAIAPAIRITGLNVLDSLQNLMGLFVFIYASLHVLAWVAVDLNWNWQVIIEQTMQSPYLIPGVAAYLLLIPLLTNCSNLVQDILGDLCGLIGKLIFPIVILSMIHFFLATSEDRTMPGIYA
ncbi:MAG: ferric reductase-like transmembrane domain-containing protein, partial [Methylococcales bacterium]